MKRPIDSRLVVLSEQQGSCRLWRAATDKDGYGLVKFEGRMRRAHRLAYELAVGPIPEGLQLDHLCKTPACIEPSHLEPVTNAENQRRRNLAKTHCVNGHEFTPENTGRQVRRGVDKGRCCRACHRQALRRSRARKVAS